METESHEGLVRPGTHVHAYTTSLIHRMSLWTAGAYGIVYEFLGKRGRPPFVPGLILLVMVLVFLHLFHFI